MERILLNDAAGVGVPVIEVVLRGDSGTPLRGQRASRSPAHLLRWRRIF
jgi:hypothetical protein